MRLGAFITVILIFSFGLTGLYGYAIIQMSVDSAGFRLRTDADESDHLFQLCFSNQEVVKKKLSGGRKICYAWSNNNKHSNKKNIIITSMLQAYLMIMYGWKNVTLTFLGALIFIIRLLYQ